MAETEENRIDRLAADMEAWIADRGERMEEMGRALDLDLAEFVVFQEVRIRALQQGRITESESLSLASALGQTSCEFNAQPIHVKAAVYNAITDLAHGVGEFTFRPGRNGLS